MFRDFAKKFLAFEIKIRRTLSRYPGVYAILAAVSLILFWEGVSEVARGYQILTGPVLIIITTPVIAILGVFLPFFVSDKSLLSDLSAGEEKIEHEIKHEEKTEEKMLSDISEKIHEMDSEIHEIQKKMDIRK